MGMTSIEMTNVMNCTLCKQEIKLNQEVQIRNDHVYHECCAMTYDNGETDDVFTLSN